MSKKSPFSNAKTTYTKSLIGSKFWQHKTLEQMNREEWEAICDGCGKCCLHKFIHDEAIDQEFVSSPSITASEDMHYSNIACYLFDDDKCQCSNYSQRSTLVPDCVTLTPENLDAVYFMPPSCSYKRLQEGRGLANWHPLLNNGSKVKMHRKGISARHKTVSESSVELTDFEDYIVVWPLYDSD